MKTQTVLLTLTSGLLASAAFAAPRSATFDVRHELNVTMPNGVKLVRVWFAAPQSDPPHQQVKQFKVDAPVPSRLTVDSAGNKMVYFELTEPQFNEFDVVATFKLTRHEQLSGVEASKAKPLPADKREEMRPFLGTNQHVIIDDRIRKLAAEIVGTETNPVLAARKLYDWTLANIDYWVKDPKSTKASPVGSTEYCLTTRTGDCTDFHSAWTSLARASGIPTRMVYGSFFKKELDGQDADQSYHCWPEFYVTGFGWVPHDVAVADIFSGIFPSNADNEKLVRLTTADGYSGPDKAKVDYYFGNLDERRVTWSRGRDLTLSPKQAGGPVNAMAKAYIEIDGKPAAEKEVWTRKLTFREIKP